VNATTITIEVDPASAAAFATAPADERRRIELLLKLRLREITAQHARSLGTIMDEIGDHAAAQGMTSQKLDELLRDQ
jgi:hypothetical protein